MTAQNAKDYLPLVQALADGKTIQVYSELSLVWCDVLEPEFSEPAHRYRIKPEPRVRWIVKFKNGNEVTYHTEAMANEVATFEGVTYAKFQEVI